MQPRRADFFFAAMYAAGAAQVLLSGQGSRGTLKGPRPKNNWSSLADPICFLQLRMQPVLFKYCLVVKDPGVHLKDLLRNHPSKNAQRGVLNEMVIWGGRFFGPVVK